ncbi:type IV secretion system protein [Fastidiosibacter lacustris]|uniref:type IV secretion system protein n=1 Tax=Fastidiosibacter lacustris TaxID=2056695 RepID=UPI000E348FFD|nr:type IV secretion system protein [Fastidiosibacter lacustris]
MKEEQQGKTNYQRAYEEWEARIGSAKKQARNWMMASIAILIICILLVLAIIIEANRQKMYVYVAEVKPQESVVNVQTASQSYVPTVAQKISFASDFIKNITEIPLDPIVLNRQWQAALLSVSGRAEDQLKQVYQALNPLKLIGDKTITTVVTNANEASNNSFEITFQTTTYNRDGAVESVKIYSGIFTFSPSIPPKTLNQMIINPLGLKLGFFSFSEKGSSQ